jgi:pyruvate dehydrogenase (quinone)
MASVAEVVIDALTQAGVKRLYGVVGDSLNYITDAIRRSGKIQWIQVRHEETGAFAAGAEAQLSGQLCACAGSCGPGNLHLINGLYDAQGSGAPVLAIAAHIPSSEIGTNYFQETHPERIFVECSHYCELVSTPNQMPRAVQIAMQTALSKNGVSVMVLPGDVAMSKAPDAEIDRDFTAVCARVRPCRVDLDRLAGLVNISDRVTLLCGVGCAGAHRQVMKLAEILNAPVVHTLREKDQLEFDNPYDVGMTGLIGHSSGYLATESCDLLLLLGTDFPYDNFYPSKAKIAQIDIRPERLGRRCRLDLGLVGDVRETLDALIPSLQPKTDDRHLQTALSHYKDVAAKMNSQVLNAAKEKPIHPEYLASQVNEFAAGDAIFTADTGMCTVWAARYLRMRKGRRLLASFHHGSMANALPQAIGAQLLHPDRQVVAFCGDGGLAMLMGDLLTLVQYDLPIKLVVFNNSTLGMVKLEMMVAGIPDFGTDFKPFNFARIAEAAGIKAMRVEDPADIRDALAQAFLHKGPALVDVATNPLELAMPPKVTAKQVLGMSLYMLKQTLDGDLSEVKELIANNVHR